MPIVVDDGAATVTVPAAVAVSQVPPAGTVATAALQRKGFVHAPAALMATCCGMGAGWPSTLWKTSAGADVATEQGACTIKVTGSACGLPAAAWPLLSVPVMVTVPP